MRIRFIKENNSKFQKGSNMTDKKKYPHNIISILIVILFSNIYSQDLMSSAPLEIEATPGDYTISSERYFTKNGVIFMYVNVWGNVNRPGNHQVYDGIDLATLLSVTGGPGNGADLKKVRLYREIPDENGRQSYTLNLEKFMKNGDRSDFVKVLPNDTYIIPKTNLDYVLDRIGTLQTLMIVLNLYFQIAQYRSS